MKEPKKEKEITYKLTLNKLLTADVGELQIHLKNTNLLLEI